MDLPDLEQRLGLKFKNRKLLETAFIHRSYLNEHPDQETESNERLEFLGDSVLSIVVTEYLFQKFQDYPEGKLTGFRSLIISRQFLSRVAKNLNLGQYLQMARGEEESGGKQNPSILANTCEALLGAIFLELGIPGVKKVIFKEFLPLSEPLLQKGDYKDFKSELQEFTQREYHQAPRYKTIKTAGPDHAKKFTIGVFLKGNLVSEGTGASKQQAEQEAAKSALSQLKNHN